MVLLASWGTLDFLSTLAVLVPKQELEFLGVLLNSNSLTIPFTAKRKQKS